MTHEGAQPLYRAPRPIGTRVLVGWSIVSLGVSGLAWLWIWQAIFFAQQDLIEGLPVVTSWMTAGTFCAASIAGAAVCLGLCRRVESHRSRTRAVVSSSVALAVGIATALFVVALPFM
ncbi:hypothetical protein GCM10025760_34380 [Microbacterium yannicii]|uniref:Uncharacterized protein n=1 Tax=Microbacterium yannicii TaxID=671622 RepID=A0ABP9MR27_9MICO|nr:hypothetical protein [Microbacterium yannicii]MCO5951902.1 hypothetical protein [Microbacterium yannicii]